MATSLPVRPLRRNGRRQFGELPPQLNGPRSPLVPPGQAPAPKVVGGIAGDALATTPPPPMLGGRGRPALPAEPVPVRGSTSVPLRSGRGGQMGAFSGGTAAPVTTTTSTTAPPPTAGTAVQTPAQIAAAKQKAQRQQMRAERRANRPAGGAASALPPGAPPGSTPHPTDPDLFIGPDGITYSPVGYANTMNARGGLFGDKVQVSYGTSGGAATGGGTARASGAGGGGGGGGRNAGDFINDVERDPVVDRQVKRYEDRFRHLLATEKEANTLDTERLKTSARNDIAQNAAAARAQAEIAAARMGRGAEGSNYMSNRIGDRQARLAADAETRIELEQQRAQDARDDRRRSELNAYLLGGLPTALAPAELGLRKGALAIEQARASNTIENGNSDADLAAWLQFLRLPSGTGTGGSSPSTIRWI